MLAKECCEGLGFPSKIGRARPEANTSWPWDGSPLAEQALGFSTCLARLLDTELVVYRALLPPRADMVATPDLVN